MKVNFQVMKLGMRSNYFKQLVHHTSEKSHVLCVVYCYEYIAWSKTFVDIWRCDVTKWARNLSETVLWCYHYGNCVQHFVFGILCSFFGKDKKQYKEWNYTFLSFMNPDISVRKVGSYGNSKHFLNSQKMLDVQCSENKRFALVLDTP